MARYLVVGGAGRTGRRVVTQLVGHGGQVRVLSRHPGPQPAGVDTVTGDLAAFGPGQPALDDIDGIVVSVEPPYDAAGAEAVLHRGVETLATAAARRGCPVVLVSQIYVTRPRAYPQMAAVTQARGRGEQALRDSGAAYAIIRPGWLHDRPAVGVRLEQGDTGDGPVSRDTVAAACTAALLTPAEGVTFEVFDDTTASSQPADWAVLLGRLAPDQPAGAPHAR